jgi:NAD(P)H-dependent FMN reductase
MTRSLQLAMIYGSVRPNRFCDTVADWVAAQVAAGPDFQLERIDPREDWPDVPVARFRSQVDAADAVLVVTPEYNRSFPGPLKVLIDAADVEWRAKPVAFVSYGGVSGGLRAIEHLRNVFVELHAAPIRDAVSFPNAWEAFPEGRPRDERRSARALQSMLTRLAWWARALKSAREAQAYGEVA